MRRRRATWIAAVAVAAVLSPAASLSAGTIRHDTAGSLYTGLADNSAYAPVGKFTWNETAGAFLSSATLISPRYILIAAHCIDDSSVTNMVFNLAGTNYTGIARVVHPNFTGTLSTGWDIGLVKLSTAVTSITPAARFLGSDELGKTITMVGYGNTGNGLTGYTSNTSGIKRAGTNTVDAYAGASSGRILEADFDDPGNADGKNARGSSTPTDLEYSIAPGDSGGGAFINVNANAYLAGVNSYISALSPPNGDSSANASYSDLMGLTRVSSHNAWIDDNIATAWTNIAGGAFATASNWSASNPVTGDVAAFSLNNTYTVALGASRAHDRLLARAGNVTLDLSNATYTLTNASLEAALTVAKYAGETASLTITHGTLVTTSSHAALAPLPGATATVSLGANAHWNAASVHVGGNLTGHGGAATLNIADTASLNVVSTLNVHPGGTVQLTGGDITGAAITNNGQLLALSGSSSTTAVEGAGSITVSPGATLHLPALRQTSLNILGTPLASLAADPLELPAPLPSDSGAFVEDMFLLATSAPEPPMQNTPEPSSLSALALGLLAMFRRRRPAPGSLRSASPRR